MATFDEIVIIYNPNSTGDGKKNAEKLQHDIGLHDSNLLVTLRQTDHAGHAEQMAHDYASLDKRYALISSSGDGGYHELVNGVIASGSTNVTVGLLPSGNANDHYNAVIEDSNIVDNCINANSRTIDVIKVSSTVNGEPWVRYAHSYAGIGLSPTIGKQLTKSNLNIFNEKWLVAKYLFTYTHATVRIDGIKKRFSSLVFSNIDQMSKVLKLSQSSQIDDGKFEISAISYRTKFHVIWMLLKSATFGLEELGSFQSYSFQTTKRLLIQLDGEVYTLDADSNVTVECISHPLHTIL